MDTNSIIGTLLTTAAISGANTGGIVGQPGTGVHTESNYQSVYINNTVQGDNSGGTSVTTVDTNDNGVVNHSTKTEHIPPGAVQQIQVDNNANAAEIQTHVQRQINRAVHTHGTGTRVQVASPAAAMPYVVPETQVTPAAAAPAPEPTAPIASGPVDTQNVAQLLRCPHRTLEFAYKLQFVNFSTISCHFFTGEASTVLSRLCMVLFI